MRAVLILLIILVALSGCFGGKDDKLSQDEMEERSAQAVQRFRQAIGPGGDLVAIEVTGDVAVEYEANGLPLIVHMEPDFAVQMGDRQDVLLVGELGPIDITSYCSPDRLVVLMEGGEQYDFPDTSVETRNPESVCTGNGVVPLLLTYFEFELIDPGLLVGDIYVEDMEALDFSDEGDIIADYKATGPLGETILTLRIDDGRIEQIITENEQSTLVMKMTYGDRQAIEVPEADERLPTKLRGSTRDDGGQWTWEGYGVEGGPIDEYVVIVLPDGDGAGTACSGRPEGVVSFDLGDGAFQTKDNWRLDFVDDGDGILGQGDEIHLTPPASGVQEFENDVVIYDAWADALAGGDVGASCAIPGISFGWLGLGVLALAFVRRRR